MSIDPARITDALSFAGRPIERNQNVRPIFNRVREKLVWDGDGRQLIFDLLQKPCQMDDLHVRWRQNEVWLTDSGFEQKVFSVIVHQ
jgi:hypothetical protein